MHLPKSASDAEILEFVDRWTDELALGEYDRAYARTAHDAYYQWSASLIREVIAGYGLPEAHPSGEVFSVTPRALAAGEQSTREVTRREVPPGAIALVSYNLPLNGEWSDLTATFRLEAAESGLVVILEEIHVR